MANELTINASLAFSKGGRSVSTSVSALKLDVSGTDHIKLSQTIGTSAEAIDLGDITTPGYCLVKNLDDTNFVELRDGASGDDLVKVRAGGVALFELATTTPFGIADTAACECEITIIEA